MPTPISVAFAEDHSMYRKSLIYCLQSISDEIKFVIEADNGRQLIEQLFLATCIPDVCILDVNMPEMNGYETLVEIHSQWPEMRVLALSMHNNDFAVINMFRRGATGYVVKFGEPLELLNAIRCVYFNGFYHSELMNGLAAKEVLLPQIKDKEMQFLKWCCLDLSYHEIADQMNVSPRTVEWYRDTLFKKLNVKTRTGLALFAMQIGLAPLSVAH